MQMMFFAVFLIVGAATVSAVGTITTGYGVSTGTFTDATCTTAISYSINLLGFCVKTGLATSMLHSADATGNIFVTSYTTVDCSGTASSEGILTLQVCTCVAGGCTKKGYYSASIPAVPGPYQTTQAFEGATVCTGTPTSLYIAGLDPTSAGTGCSQTACSQSTSNNVARAMQTVCTVPTGTLTGIFQQMYYTVRCRFFCEMVLLSSIDQHSYCIV
jgi:hypothetical protein